MRDEGAAFGRLSGLRRATVAANPNHQPATKKTAEGRPPFDPLIL